MFLKDSEFERNYVAEVLTTSADTVETFVFSKDRTTESENGGLVLGNVEPRWNWTEIIVTPKNRTPWVGSFEPEIGELSGLFSTPNPCSICVVVSGQGYWVSVNEPSDYQVIPFFPVKHVRPVPENKILILADLERIAIYGKDGFDWQTPKLSWDGLQIDNVISGSIKGVGWDAPNDCEIGFEINILDRTCVGGINR